MGLLIREIIGWVFVGLGLLLVAVLFVMATNRQVIEAAALSIPATVIFRGGLGLVRLASAGRIATAIEKVEPRIRRSPKP